MQPQTTEDSRGRAYAEAATQVAPRPLATVTETTAQKEIQRAESPYQAPEPLSGT